MGRTGSLRDSKGNQLHIEWMDKVLLYSPGTCIQYPGINHNGKNMKKNVCVCVCVCVCVTESFFCTSEINTTL